MMTLSGVRNSCESEERIWSGNDFMRRAAARRASADCTSWRTWSQSNGFEM